MTDRLVLIEWIDSKGTTTSWEMRQELDPLLPSRCCSVGFLLEDTDDYKTLAMTTSETQILGRLTIPTAAITKIKRLRWRP